MTSDGFAKSVPDEGSYESTSAPWPSGLRVFKEEGRLEIDFSDGYRCSLPAEYLRVESPSAEVQGHGKPILQTGKLNVGLERLEPAGNYALKLCFDDGHDSGLYTWDYLYQLATRQEQLWADYLQQLAAAGKSRDPDESVVRLML